jgi:hypothetical protein
LVADHVAHAHAARFGNSFEPRCHVDPVAVNVPAINDDVSDVYADAKFDLPVRRSKLIKFTFDPGFA